jgi:hypothetical protein
VERSDDDYTRIVALNAPSLRPETSLDEVTEYAQQKVDVIDLDDRCLRSLRVDEVIRQSPDLPIHLFATRRRDGGHVLTFEELLWGTPFVEQIKGILTELRAGYKSQVDVEFTGNVGRDGELRLNLVQCRPLQVREGGTSVPLPRDLAPGDLLLESRGPLVGQSTYTAIDRIVYVDPDAYTILGTQDRHQVARVVGRATRLPGKRHTLLLGPGRWGTTTPTLGVPVSFPEIQRVSALCEIMRLGDVIPDVSLGSHFFNDLVEEAILYVAVFPGSSGYVLDEPRLRAAPNLLPTLCPNDADMAHVVRVVDVGRPGSWEPRTLWLNASCESQEVRCYFAVPPPEP